MLWLIFAALAAYILYTQVYKPMVFWKKRGVPYSKAVPLLGNSVRQIFQRESVADTLVRLYNEFPEERYFGTYMFTKPVLCIRDLGLLKQLTIKDFDHFTDHFILISKETDHFMGSNLLSLKGNEWRKMRSILSPAFTGSKMRGMFLFMIECAENFANHFTDTVKGEVTEVELKNIFTRYANDVIASATFGVKCNSLVNENNEFYKMGEKITTFTVWTFIKFALFAVAPGILGFFKLRLFPKEPIDFFHKIVVETIEAREEQKIYRPDMIQLLIEAKKGLLEHDNTIDSDTGFATVEESSVTKTEKFQMQELTNDTITAQALIFFLAGFDTSSTIMSFMVLELAINPDIQEKLVQEINEAMADCNGKLTYEAIVTMTYLDQVVSETLRKWTPGFQTDRLCVKEYIIEPDKPTEEPLTIPKGMPVFIPNRAIHYDPKYFPNPDSFDPERFSEENKGSIVPGSYLPFGVGPRNCIGSRFALLEVKVMAVYLLHKFEVVVTKKTPLPLKLTKKRATLAPDGGFWVGLKLRKS